MSPKSWLPGVYYYITKFGWAQSDQQKLRDCISKLANREQRKCIAAKLKALQRQQNKQRHPQGEHQNMVAWCMIIYSKLWIGSIGPVEAEQLHFQVGQWGITKVHSTKLKAVQKQQN
jgi:hypothetical protein